MKLLFYSWDANNEISLKEALLSLGHEIVVYDKPCVHYTRDMSLAQDMISFINSNMVEGVISFNYFPIISSICQATGIQYYSWVYDCPHLTLFAGTVNYPCNHIGIFDRDMVRELQSLGVSQAFHLPLAVDVNRFEKTINNSNNSEAYRCSVSFVGSLKTGENDYFNVLSLPEGIKQQTLSLIEGNTFQYKNYHPQNLIDDNRSLFFEWEKALRENQALLGEDYFAKNEEIVLSQVIEKQMTIKERVNILSKIANEYQNEFFLYTNSVLDDIPILGACNHGVVDYHTQMPVVFRNSDINLNISLRSIHSGIPLRVLDIMACGGFVLSNYQPEISEYFTEGEEIVIFDSPQDCLKKIQYYLSHEDERQRIAQKGQNAVLNRFSYANLLPRLFEAID